MTSTDLDDGLTAELGEDQLLGLGDGLNALADGDVRAHNRSHKPGRRRINPRPRPRPSPLPQNRYPHVYAWVTDWLAVVYAHEQNDQLRGWRWCPEWYRHPAAVTRLEAAWRAWEALRHDAGTGASAWFRDHGDICLRVLTDPDHGPFAQCTTSRHVSPPGLCTALSAEQLSAVAQRHRDAGLLRG